MERTVLVAGVGRTIGAAVARRFHADGWNVGLFARSPEFIETLASDLDDGALAVPTDVTDPDAVAAGVETVREAFGQIEVLVLNASAGGGNEVEDVDLEGFEEIWRVRAYGGLACVKEVLPDLRETGGTVLFSGTSYATETAPGQVEWGSAAPATRGLALTLADAFDGVQVCYVRIGSAVRPTSDGWDGAIAADSVADVYRDLVDQGDAMMADVDLRRR